MVLILIKVKAAVIIISLFLVVRIFVRINTVRINERFICWDSTFVQNIQENLYLATYF